MKIVYLLAAAAGAISIAQAAHAAHPEKPVRIVVPYAPDGYTLLAIDNAYAVLPHVFKNPPSTVPQ